MTYLREPVLQPVPIETLRPTQITVGMREVEEKRKRLRKQKPQKIGAFIGHHMIPVVLGPKKRHYVIDHHHLSLALYKEGLRDVLVTVVLDLSALDPDAFWTVLEHKSLVYPFDAQGRRRDFADIPKTVMQLKDDPFRSPRRRAAASGRFCQGHHPVQRVSVGGFFPPQDQKEGGRSGFFRRDGAGAAPGEKRRGGISAGLVRPQGRRMIAGITFDLETITGSFAGSDFRRDFRV